MSTVSKSAALWHQPEARFWPRMKDWVNFHIHKPPVLSNPIFCSFRCKEKIKSSVEKISGGNSSGGGFEAKFKKNNSIVKIFQGFRVFFYGVSAIVVQQKMWVIFLVFWFNLKGFWGVFLVYFWYLSFIGLLLAQILKGWWVASRAVGCRVPTIFWVAGGGAGEGGNEVMAGGRKCDLEMN